FHDDGRLGKTGDDAVPTSEIRFAAQPAWGRLRDKCATFSDDPRGELAVARRIDAVDWRGQHSHSSAPSLERCQMRAPVDPYRETRHDGEPGASELIGDLRRRGEPVTGWVPRAHDRDGRVSQCVRWAEHVEHWR